VGPPVRGRGRGDPLKTFIRKREKKKGEQRERNKLKKTGAEGSGLVSPGKEKLWGKSSSLQMSKEGVKEKRRREVEQPKSKQEDWGGRKKKAPCG